MPKRMLLIGAATVALIGISNAVPVGAASVVEITSYTSGQGDVIVYGVDDSETIRVVNDSVFTSTRPKISIGGCEYQGKTWWGHQTKCALVTFWSVHGLGGNDQLEANVRGRNVSLAGGSGNDVITLSSFGTALGDGGDDDIFGSPGRDVLKGGMGADDIVSNEVVGLQKDKVFCGAEDGPGDRVWRDVHDVLEQCRHDDVMFTPPPTTLLAR